MELKIENGAPIPPRKGRERSGSTDAIRKLEVSQSVLLPTTMSTAVALVHAVKHEPECVGRVFTSRTIKGEGVRVMAHPVIPQGDRA